MTQMGTLEAKVAFIAGGVRGQGIGHGLRPAEEANGVSCAKWAARGAMIRG